MPVLPEVWYPSTAPLAPVPCWTPVGSDCMTARNMSMTVRAVCAETTCVCFGAGCSMTLPSASFISAMMRGSTRTPPLAMVW